MADECDRSDHAIETSLAQAVADCATASTRRTLLPIQRCHYCGEDVKPGHLFCDVRDNDCAKDWEYEQARKREQGR